MSNSERVPLAWHCFSLPEFSVDVRGNEEILMVIFSTDFATTEVNLIDNVMKEGYDGYILSLSNGKLL